MDKLRSIIFVIAFIGLYVGGPILLIAKIKKHRQKKKEAGPRPPRNYKLFPIWSIIINAVPAAILTYLDQTNNLDGKYGDICFIILTATGLITIICTISQCKLTGLWLGPLRWIAGLTAGVAIVAAIIVGILLVALLCSGGGGGYQITVDDEEVSLYWDEGSNCYIGSDGKNYYVASSEYRSYVHDIYGHTYTIH